MIEYGLYWMGKAAGRGNEGRRVYCGKKACLLAWRCAAGARMNAFIGLYIAFGVIFGHVDDLTTSYQHAKKYI